MFKRYCKGLPLYCVLIAATLLAHAIAQEWDARDDNAEPPTRTLLRHA